MPKVILPHISSSSFLSFVGFGKRTISYLLLIFSSSRARGALYYLDGFLNLSLRIPRLDIAYVKTLQLRDPKPVARSLKIDSLFVTD